MALPCIGVGSVAPRRLNPAEDHARVVAFLRVHLMEVP